MPFDVGGRLSDSIILRGVRLMPKVVFVNEKKEIEVPEGANLRLEARKAGIEIYKGLDRFLNCRGLGLCGTCKVLVKKGMENLGPKGMTPEKFKEYQEKVAKGEAKPNRKTLRERFTLGRMFSAIGHEDEMRLACQVSVHGDCTVETKPTFNWSGENFWQKPYPNK
jgi:ferredoxin